MEASGSRFQECSRVSNFMLGIHGVVILQRGFHPKTGCCNHGDGVIRISMILGTSCWFSQQRDGDMV